MSRILKLLAIFISIIATLFIVLNWSTFFKQDTGIVIDPNDGKIDISMLCDKIRAAWDKENSWNKKLYKSHSDALDQFKLSKLFASEDDYQTARGALWVSARNTAHDSYMDALNARPFKAKDLKSAHDGLLELEELSGIKDDRIIARDKDSYNCYCSLAKFIETYHNMIAPSFSLTAGIIQWWEPFENQREDVLEKADKLRSNPYFWEMPNRQSLPGHDDLKLQLTGQAPAFFSDLSDQIISYFKGYPRNNDSFLLLRSVLNKYAEEAGLYSLSSSELFEFTSSFEEEIPSGD